MKNYFKGILVSLGISIFLLGSIIVITVTALVFGSSKSLKTVGILGEILSEDAEKNKNWIFQNRNEV